MVDAQEVEVTGWDLGFLWSAQEGTQGHFLNRGYKTPGRPSPKSPGSWASEQLVSLIGLPWAGWSGGASVSNLSSSLH